MNQVELTYRAWFRVFKDAYVPRLISQPKWFKITEDLKEKDIVYFRKHETDLDDNWTVGQVDQIIRSKDGFVRRAVIKYFNAGDNHPQFTDRAVRKLVKLWSLDESAIYEDLHDVHHDLSNSGLHMSETAHKLDPLANADVLCTSFPPQGVTLAGHYLNLHVTGHTLVYQDGLPINSSWTVPCDVHPLVVSGCMANSSEIGPDAEDEDKIPYQVDEEEVGIDTLYGILVSTGFSLQ